MEYEKCDRCGGDCKSLNHKYNGLAPSVCAKCGDSYYECYDCFLDSLFEMPIVVSYEEKAFCCKACGRNEKIDRIIKKD